MTADPSARPSPSPSLWYRAGPLLAAGILYLVLIAHPAWWHVALWPNTLAGYGLPFVDMHGHLAASRAFADGTLVAGDTVPGDLLKRIHAGPTWMLSLGWLGLGPEHTTTLVACSLAAFLLTLGLTVRPENGRESLLLFLVLTGPPVLLLVERANIDLLVFVGLAGAFAAMGSRGRAGRWGGWALIVAFIGFKYYPALGFAGLIESRAPRREKWLALGLGAVAVTAFILWTWEEIRYVGSHQVENRFFPFFGARELFVMTGHAHGTATRLSLVAWLVLTAGVARLLGPLTELESSFDARKIPFVGGGAILLFCFLVTSSPDYRLAFLLFCLPWLWRLGRRDGGGTRALRLTATVCLALFVITPWLGPLAGRGALAVESTRWWWAVLFAKQLAWWALTAGLGALLARQLAGRVREWFGPGRQA